MFVFVKWAGHNQGTKMLPLLGKKKYFQSKYCWLISEAKYLLTIILKSKFLCYCSFLIYALKNRMQQKLKQPLFHFDTLIVSSMKTS